MRFSPTFLLILCTLCLAAGCASTPQDRIARNRDIYRSYPSDVQRKITAGVVDVGFTPEMVRMALGAPTRVISRQSELGSTEIWVYRENSPRVSVGFGIGSYGRHSASSIGVATTTGGRERGESERVEFHEGKVTKVESSRG